MPDLHRARLLTAVVLALSASACGRKTSSTDSAPPVVIYQVADLQLTSLQVDARTARDGV